jgi:hypothetical protein
MELLLSILVAATIAILSQAAGVDSRDLDPRCQPRAW